MLYTEYLEIIKKEPHIILSEDEDKLEMINVFEDIELNRGDNLKEIRVYDNKNTYNFDESSKLITRYIPVRYDISNEYMIHYRYDTKTESFKICELEKWLKK